MRKSPVKRAHLELAISPDGGRVMSGALHFSSPDRLRLELESFADSELEVVRHQPAGNQIRCRQHRPNGFGIVRQDIFDNDVARVGRMHATIDSRTHRCHISDALVN